MATVLDNAGIPAAAAAPKAVVTAGVLMVDKKDVPAVILLK
jgi:hypothetical protein